MDGELTSGLNDGSHLITADGLVEDVGYSFLSMTGYSKSDLHHKRISEVMIQLFGFELKKDCRKTSAFLFKKSREAIEVYVTKYKIGKSNLYLYLFEQKINSILNSELSLISRLIKDNYAGVGLYSCPDLRLLKANRRYLDYLQDACLTDDNPVGRCLDQLIPDNIGSDKKEIWERVYKTGETVCLKDQISVSESGDCRYWNETITPLTEDGEVRYIITIIDDITDYTQRSKYMEEKNRELEQAIKMEGEMLMLISHELKTPLSVITSSIQTVEMVCSDELSETMKKYLNKIKQNAYRQMKLVNNILDNTRVNSGLFKINPNCVDIVHLTGAIIDSISVFAERKGIRICYNTEIAKHVIVTDLDVYERILLNLLSNAVKFTPEGETIEVTVSSVYGRGKKQVCIQVKDSGIGIPSDQKDLIFERFGRVNRMTARHSEGTGIGLYLVKTLVSLLDGEIMVESKEGVGSTFSLLLPAENFGKAAVEPVRIEKNNDQRITSTAIEFSDIYFGT